MSNPDGPSSPEPIRPSEAQPKGRTVPSRSQFQQHMKEGAKPPAAGEAPGGVAPVGEGKAGASTAPTIDTLLNQVQTSQGNLHDIKSKLETPNLALKRQHQTLLRDKLNDAKGHMKAANSKLGISLPSDKNIPDSHGPIAKFLGYVTDGQNQLVATQNQLKEMSKKPGQMNPADLLLVQVKLSQAQQELEYSSVLLGKVVDVFKQMLNIQI